MAFLAILEALKFDFGQSVQFFNFEIYQNLNSESLKHSAQNFFKTSHDPKIVKTGFRSNGLIQGVRVPFLTL